MPHPPPPGVAHCSSIEACVLGIEGHHDFVGNCIGRGNRRLFATFLLLATATAGLFAILSYSAHWHMCRGMTRDTNSLLWNWLVVEYGVMRSEPAAFATALFAAYASMQLGSIFGMQMIFVARETSMHHIIRGRFTPSDDANMRRALQKVVNFWTTGHYLIAKDSVLASKLKSERSGAASRAEAGSVQEKKSAVPPPPPPLSLGGGEAEGVGEVDPLLSAMRRDILAGGRATSFRGADPYGHGQGHSQGAAWDVEEGAGTGGGVGETPPERSRGSRCGVVRAELDVRTDVAVEPTVDGEGRVRQSAPVHVLAGYESSRGDDDDGGEESDDDVAYARLLRETHEAQAQARSALHGGHGHDHSHDHGHGRSHGHGRCQQDSCGSAMADSRAPWERPTSSVEMNR